MRRVRAIVGATALEILSEPLVLLVTLSAMALTVFAPVFHFHQFGDSTRMARDAGVSAILLGGAIIAVFGPMHVFRRELESGTALTALALSVSRRVFFLSKTLGVALGYLFFVVTVGSLALAVVNGAAIGSTVIGEDGTPARLWGPVYVAAVGAMILPLALGAFLNRFRRFRFVLTANLLTLAFALATTAVGFNGALFARFLPLFLVIALPPLWLVAVAAAFAARFRLNAASLLTALAGALFVPFVGSYCLSDALTDGGAAPFAYSLGAFAAIIPLIAATLLAGVRMFESSEI